MAVAGDQDGDRQAVQNRAGVAPNLIVVGTAGRGDLALPPCRRLGVDPEFSSVVRARPFVRGVVARSRRAADQSAGDFPERVALAAAQLHALGGELCATRGPARRARPGGSERCWTRGRRRMAQEREIAAVRSGGGCASPTSRRSAKSGCAASATGASASVSTAADLALLRLERRRVGIVGWCEFEIGSIGSTRAFAWPDLGFKIVCGRRAFGFERLAERRSGLGSRPPRAKLRAPQRRDRLLARIQIWLDRRRGAFAWPDLGFRIARRPRGLGFERLGRRASIVFHKLRRHVALGRSDNLLRQHAKAAIAQKFAMAPDIGAADSAIRRRRSRPKSGPLTVTPEKVCRS